ncbi:AMP-binding protein [Streptomyces sp. NK08204]|uniref:AMP-binding protein n=1 Tax=Streptomyces sp. NK08204 TaxID=2873260 RepID=UPI001CECE3AA|nr:AMP-binding protein [Streptomyces sp. NK08204]
MTTTEVPGPTRLLEPLRAVARRRPDAVALEGPDAALTYRELLGRIDDAATRMRAAGVAPGDTAVLHTTRDARLPVTLLAAWSAGMCVALLDAGLPAARITACETVIRPRWRLSGGPTGLIEPHIEPHDVTGARPARGGSHILLTSGTTGGPAAVLIGPDALRRTLDWYADTFRPGPEDRVALLAGLGHDPLLRDILVPLSSGGTLLVPPADVFAHPAALLGFVRSAAPTVLHATPALLELLLAADTAAHGGGLRSLRLVVSGGARLDAGLARRLRRACEATLVNAYGATETPQIASCAPVDVAALDAAGVPDDAGLDVGGGVAGAELLLDPESGEVVVRSPSLALGYLDATGRAGRFAADPRGAAGYRAYRTGDRGERLPGGGIRITGRLDRELSVNGFRLAPEEIESAARRHPLVLEAHAQSVPGPAGDVLGLTVVPVAGAHIAPGVLRTHLAALLPRHAVPARIRTAPGLTLGPTHKATPGKWS